MFILYGVFVHFMWWCCFSHIGATTHFACCCFSHVCVVFFLSLVLLFFAHRCNCISPFGIVVFYTHEFEGTFERDKVMEFLILN
jgi:hypothetical protein